jgi:hypothetical protein
MTQPYQVLYVDSSEDSAQQLLEYFNPPSHLTPELLEKHNQKAPEEEQYLFVFDHYFSYQEARLALAARNADELTQRQGIIPFDLIFLEVNRRWKDDYSWLELVRDCYQMGLKRLGLRYGLVGFGTQASDAIKEHLNFYGVRFIKKPFYFEQLRQFLLSYIKMMEGSSTFFIEERPLSQTQEGREVIRRSLRFYDHNGKLASVALPYLEKEKHSDGSQTLWLRPNKDFSRWSQLRQEGLVAGYTFRGETSTEEVAE